MKTSTKERNAYIVLDPTGKGKTYSVAARRVGSKERYTVVATCSSDSLAARIVDGLSLLQGETVKLDLPHEKLCEDLRAQLVKAHTAADDARLKLRAVEQDKRKLENEASHLKYEINQLKKQLEEAQRHMAAAT
jgi:predicted RNase H-like nuclease (RuvC/YqgF family)